MKMKKNMLRIVVVVIVFILISVYVGVGLFYSGMIIDGRSNAYSEAEEQERLADAGLIAMPERESVTITSGDVNLAGSFYENPNDGNCAVILLHGLGSTRSSMMSFVPLFWKLGCDVLAYDLRGTGDSSPAYQTYGYYDKQDASAAVDWLSTRSGLPPSQIGIFGRSYGSAIALQTLFERDDLAFVIADSTFSSLSSIVAEQGSQMMGSWVSLFVPSALFWAGIRADFNAGDVSPEDAIAATDTPVLLIHGVEDETTSVSNSEAVYANSNQETTVLKITDWGPGHASSIRNNYDGYVTIVYSFLDMYAPAFGQ